MRSAVARAMPALAPVMTTFCVISSPATRPAPGRATEIAMTPGVITIPTQTAVPATNRPTRGRSRDPTLGAPPRESGSSYRRLSPAGTPLRRRSAMRASGIQASIVKEGGLNRSSVLCHRHRVSNSPRALMRPGPPGGGWVCSSRWSRGSLEQGGASSCRSSLSALRSSVSAWLWSGGDAPTPSGDALAGYFVGEAVKVYCPQYSYLLTS